MFLRASRNSISQSESLYLKSDIVWFRRKCRILRATCCIANATAQIPSYVYPWNLEYSFPLLESYSTRYWSGVWKKGRRRVKKEIERKKMEFIIFLHHIWNPSECIRNGQNKILHRESQRAIQRLRNTVIVRKVSVGLK